MTRKYASRASSQAAPPFQSQTGCAQGCGHPRTLRIQAQNTLEIGNGIVQGLIPEARTKCDQAQIIVGPGGGVLRGIILENSIEMFPGFLEILLHIQIVLTDPQQGIISIGLISHRDHDFEVAECLLVSCLFIELYPAFQMLARRFRGLGSSPGSQSRQAHQRECTRHRLFHRNNLNESDPLHMHDVQLSLPPFVLAFDRSAIRKRRCLSPPRCPD